MEEELLATGHGEAVRTAAGPEQPTSMGLSERRQARGGKQRGTRAFNERTRGGSVSQGWEHEFPRGKSPSPGGTFDGTAA